LASEKIIVAAYHTATTLDRVKRLAVLELFYRMITMAYHTVNIRALD
jgi:hypothetical protein